MITNTLSISKEKNKENTEKRRQDIKLKICTYIAYFFIILVMLSLIDLVRTAAKSPSGFELVNETDYGQKLCRLYIDGKNCGEADQNLYSLKDENGKTDIKYCVMTEKVSSLIYSVIISAMLLLVIGIAKNSDKTPFIKSNAKRIRAIGALQLALAVVPGVAVMLMKFFKFMYASSVFTVKDLYMFIVGAVIMAVAQVFDYGVRLQDDNDLIA